MRSTPFRLAAALLASVFALAAQADPLEIALERGGAEGTVQVTMTNTGSRPLSILRWDTPFEDTLSSDVFQVERPKKGLPLVERAVYIGREVKRAAPVADSYLILQPGRAVSQSVELNDYYSIDKADTRQVRYSGQLRYSELDTTSQSSTVRKVLSLSTLSTTALESNSVLVSVSPQSSPRVLAPAYNNCSTQQQTDILAAAELAQEYVSTGVADLQSLAANERAGSPRYTTWFGAYTEARFNRVLSNFRAIETALESEQLRFDCGCDESGVFAYVYPNRPYDIFLCPAFRAAEVGGTDSRAGTIVHELSHFTILADTDDHVYSQRGAQSLANSDPEKAISNADNHEYFAENTPALDILGASNTPDPVAHAVLGLDSPVSGSVAIDESVTYQVSGASQIILTTLSGDADLYVYTDSALTAQSCISSSASAEDICENFVEGTVYVRVFGYTAASYTLEATAGETTAPPVSSVIPLALNNGISGSLDEGERLVYQVSGAELVELESISGDADLYVFDSLEFLDSALICAANSFSADSTTDSCILPSTDMYYLLVVGYSISEFSLIAVSSTNEPTPGVESVDMGRLVAGETATEFIAAGQFHFFVVSEATSVQLTSLTGDADLAIYATADFADEGQICSSALYTAESALDECALATAADHYIAVFGYEAGNYSLTAIPVGLLPDDDDPVPVDMPVETPVEPQVVTPGGTPVASSGGSSGGGSLNFWVLGMLVLSLAWRRSVKRER